MKNELALTESKTMREEYITKDYILDKVKGLVLLPDNTNVTVQMVSEYYEVSKGTIDSLISEHNSELLLDGYKVLKGQELKDFKGYLGNPSDLKFASTLSLLSRRAVLRIGMLLRDSKIAKEVRTYLLNVEENTKVEDKLIALTQETNITILELKEELKEIKSNNQVLITENEVITHTMNILINKVDDLSNQPLFKLYDNFSSKYEKLIIAFTEIMNDKGYKSNYGKNYALFNKEFSNWTGKDFGDKKINKKDYWLNYYGIEIIQHFIYGVKQNVIVKNKESNWVDLNGIYNNKVEWKKALKSFDNKCVYCGNDEILMADHVIPQSKETSTNKLYNLVPCCQECNDKKKTMDMKDWLKLKKLEGLTEEKIQKIRDHHKKYKI